MNDIRGGRVTCYLDDIRPLRSFGERTHPGLRVHLLSSFRAKLAASRPRLHLSFSSLVSL